MQSQKTLFFIISFTPFMCHCMDYEQKKTLNKALLDTCWAAKKNDDDIDRIKHLLEAKASVNAHKFFTEVWIYPSPLYYATQNNNPEVMQLLFDNNADINEQTENGASLLHYAAMHQKTKAMQCLIRHKVNINQLNRRGETPLYNAVSSDKSDNKTNAIQILLGHGAIVDDKSINITKNPPIQSMLKQASTVQKESQRLLPMLRLFMKD